MRSPRNNGSKVFCLLISIIDLSAYNIGKHDTDSYGESTGYFRELITEFAQGIIVLTGTEPFAKEPKLSNLLRGIKWAPMRRQ